MNQLQHDSLAKNAFLAPPDPRESLDHVLRMVWRRRWRFITVAGVVVAVGAILLLIQKPLYTAHATVMVESRQPDLAATDEIVHIPSQREPDVEGEIQLIVSRQALSQVVQNLNLTRNPEFQTPLTAQLMDVLCSLRTWFDSVDNKAGRSDASADSPPANLADAVVESLQKRLKVTALGRSTIVDIAFSASDRALAAQLANAIANNYVTNRYILRQREAERAGEWLRGRLELLSDDVKAKEASVEKFRRDHSTLPDGRDLELVGTDKAKLSAELTTATIDQLRLESMLAAVVARIREGGITSAFEIGESPLADHLRDTIADLRGKLASNRADRGPRHPVVVKLEEDLKATQDELANEARSYLSKLRAEILIANRNTHALEQSLQQKTSSFDQLSAAQVTYRDLERHAAASKAVYDSFLNRSKLTEQVGFNEAQSWILSSASEPLRPTSPNIPLSLVVILATAMGMGLSAVLLVEYRTSKTILSAQQLVERGVRSLGLVPDLGWRGRNIQRTINTIVEGSDFMFADAISALYASIAQINPSRSSATVLSFTSAFPSEGKSTIVISLAAFIASTGKRVLLIDCDLQSSMLHGVFDLNCASDVTHCFSSTRDLGGAIQVDSRTGVSFLSAGPYDTLSQNLLRASWLHDSIETWRRSFDYILIDTPPVLPISDVCIMAPMADRCILVARWGKTRWAPLTHAIRQLAEAGAEIGGVIISQVDMTKLSTYDFADSDAYGKSYRQYVCKRRMTNIAALASTQPSNPEPH